MFQVERRDPRKADPIYQEPQTNGCCGPKKTGQLRENTVEHANEHTSKAKPWFIVAIVVGSLVVIGIGGFGVVGLLQTHGVVSLPQWLASAIGTVGSTPHAWGLWVMGVGGVVVGVGFVTFGSVKIDQIRKNEDKFQKFKENRNNYPDMRRAGAFPDSTIFDDLVPEAYKKAL